MSVTIRDVALKAGVSTSTVSKVLNHWTTISPETSSHVLDVIKELDYTPNTRAVSFAKGATNTIIFLTDLSREESYANPHMFDIMCGSENSLFSQGYRMIVDSIPAEMRPDEYLRSVISSGIADGMIIHGSAFHASMEKVLMETSFPHILIGFPGNKSRLSWVDADNSLAGQIAAKHLLDCGYTKIAFIGGKKSDTISVKRLNGFEGWMYDFGYKIPDTYVKYTSSSLADASAAANELLSLDTPPEAIICESNMIAIGLIKALEKDKINVPKDLAFLTFDIYPYTKIMEPEPTVVNIDVYDLGIQAAISLVRKITNPSLLVQTYTTLPVIRQGRSTRNVAH